VPTPANACFRSGTFSAANILSYWGQGISKAKDTGRSPFRRATGEMPPVLNHPDGSEAFPGVGQVEHQVHDVPQMPHAVADLERDRVAEGLPHRVAEREEQPVLH
jgi:hypothetical protein